MRWSLRIGTIAGAEVKIHISCLLLVLYVVNSVGGSQTTTKILVVTGLLALTFACVFLHELGHTLAARLYGIEVPSIVLWLFGGFAMLTRQPERPGQRLVIYAAGPLVNLWIAALLWVLLGFGPGWQASAVLRLTSSGVAIGTLIAFLTHQLAWINVLLALFNLIPAYPLDGGKILRTLLEMAVGPLRANQAMLYVTIPLVAALALYGLSSGNSLLIFTAPLLLLGLQGLSAETPLESSAQPAASWDAPPVPPAPSYQPSRPAKPTITPSQPLPRWEDLQDSEPQG